MDELRKGRSRIVEKGHIAILGWDARVPEIVSELAIANEEVGGKKSRARIAILANRDIDRMEEDLEDVDLKTSSLILRRGSPSTRTIHSLHHVVAELVARESHALAQSVAPDANLLCADEIVSRIIAQSVLEPRLTEVYQDLLDFSGSEFYTFQITDSHLAVGMTFAELVLSSPAQVPAGLIGVSGIMYLPAQWDTIIQPGMSVICLSEDDYGLEIEQNAALELPRAKARPQREEPDRDVLVYAGESKKLPIIQARLVERQARVEVLAYPQAELEVPVRYSTVILLSDESLGVQAADAVAMILLLRLRNMELTASIIAEILDPKNIELMWSARADDCIASYQFSAYALTQAAENTVLVRVVRRLLGEEGVRLKVRPVSGYLSQEGTFYDLTEAAMARGEISSRRGLAERDRQSLHCRCTSAHCAADHEEMCKLPEIVSLLQLLQDKDKITEYLALILQYVLRTGAITIQQAKEIVRELPHGEETVETTADILRKEGEQRGKIENSREMLLGFHNKKREKNLRFFPFTESRQVLV